VAAISRNSVLIGCVPPTRSISHSWIAASALLQLDSQVAHLVEKQRAAAGELEFPQLLPDGAVNDPFSCAKSVLSTSSFGMAARLTGTSGLFGSPALAVDQARQQLLARAALAEDEHPRRQLGDLVHELDDVARCAARADDELRARCARRPRR